MARPRLLPVALAVTGKILVRPRLWGTAVATLAAASPPGWWRHPPFVPRPDREYLDWRFHTAYGDDGRPEPRDVVDYLDWVRVARKGAKLRRSRS